jgi:hypothetical protein
MREMTMKLNLIFLVMELLTLLAYPIVFVHGQLLQFSNSKAGILLANLWSSDPVAPDR